MDMPTRCADCPMRNSVKRNITICHPTIKELDDNEYYEKKPDWCPLVPMPEKKEFEEEKKAIEQECYDEDDISDDAYLTGKVSGWNACIDEI